MGEIYLTNKRLFFTFHLFLNETMLHLTQRALNYCHMQISIDNNKTLFNRVLFFSPN